MPFSASSPNRPESAIDAFNAATAGHRHLSGSAHYGVLTFRRAADGAVVPGALVEVPNGEIAWRHARAAAFDHDNVGAVGLRDGVLLARFGEVDLNALPE